MKIYELIRRPAVQLFLTSFAILYLELALIRFIPAYVRYLGYFTNVILLGSFLGIGIGCLLANKKRDFLVFFPPLLFILLILIKLFKFEVQISSSQVLYFKSNTEDTLVESWFLLPSIFLVISFLFATLAQKLGRLFGAISPLKAYTIDIIGSIVGIIIFTIGSFFVLPAIAWFGVFSILYLILAQFRWKIVIFSVILLFFSLLVIPTLDDLDTIWSPYYKVQPYSVSNPRRVKGGEDSQWRLYVNNISHQEMTKYDRASDFYKSVYQVTSADSFKRILIVGSGSGQDVNVALKNTAATIDAVEIDPAIATLGKKLHPDKPYSNPRVHLIINDARSYLENTSKTYDLIIFALPDSAVLSTSLSNLRLESYLFTMESFKRVKEHLTPNGLFLLYNYYRTDWLVDKIAAMLKDTFNNSPLVTRYEDTLAVFMIGPKVADIKTGGKTVEWQSTVAIPYATDDWPFLYLKDITIPNIYVKTLVMLFSIALLLALWATKGDIIKRFSPSFFFLGAAFLLIETKSIVNFNLLFGSTWLVNSLVFIGILLSVLAAIWVIERITIKNLYVPAVLLAMVLLLNYTIPIHKFLLPNVWIRYVLATIFFFSPIFLANIIFSALFKKTKQAADMFGVNLLGAFFGGLFEYSSLLLGYHNLILIAIVFYLLAFLFIFKKLLVKIA